MFICNKKINSFNEDFVIPNGVEIDKFKPQVYDNLRSELNLDKKSQLIVSVGNLRKQKIKLLVLKCWIF